MHLLEKTVEEEKVDIALTSEPNILLTNNDAWIKDKESNVAIRVYSKKIKVTEAITGNGYVGIKTQDITYISCYAPPNESIKNYTEFLENLEEQIRTQTNSGREVVITGDFNAKSGLWGAVKEDKRGAVLADWVAQNNLVIINAGNVPTFMRKNQSSTIDITTATSKVKYPPE